MNNTVLRRTADWLINYFTLSGQLVPQAEAEQSIREGVSFSGTNILILVLAILIASLGLNINSTAVIIGAMLISPLMGPIIGMGLGVGIHDFELIKRCLRNLLIAAGFSILASTIYFLISPVSQNHSELLARTSPSIYDVLIGFFGGGAGIIALGSRNKGNVIPGVAIATALMPPLCTAGYGLATWQLSYFFGAGYLFIINSIYIAFATFIGVKLLGYKGCADNTRRTRNIQRIVYTLAILTMLPSIWLTYSMLKQSSYQRRVENFVNDECHFPATQVLAYKTLGSGKERTLTVTLIGKVLPVDSLKLALTPRLVRYGLSDTRLNFIQGDYPSTVANDASNIRDIYILTQQTIARQQQSIDSLRAELALTHSVQNAGAELVPELKVLFPSVDDIAISRSVFSTIATAAVDTVNVALVHFSKPMNLKERQKFEQYLIARLGVKNIHIVTTDIAFTTSTK